MVGTLINLLKLDFKRAIYNKRFLIVVLIGVLLSVAHFFMEVFPMINAYEVGQQFLILLLNGLYMMILAFMHYISINTTSIS